MASMGHPWLRFKTKLTITNMTYDSRRDAAICHVFLGLVYKLR